MQRAGQIVRLTNQEAIKAVKDFLKATIEWYYECPACGNEPCSGMNLKEARIYLRDIPGGYACPKCSAITLVLTNRVKKVYADSNSIEGGNVDKYRTVAGNHRGGHVKLIKNAVRRENRGCSGRKVSDETLYAKIQSIRPRTTTKKLNTIMKGILC